MLVAYAFSMFVIRDTHKQVAHHHDGIPLAVTYDNGQIRLSPPAVMPPEVTAMITPVEEVNEEPERRDEE
jgi:hypothetical protein